MVLNWAQGLKEKSHEVSARKNNNRLRYNKKCRGGADSAPPGSFRVNIYNIADFFNRILQIFTIEFLEFFLIKYFIRDLFE